LDNLFDTTNAATIEPEKIVAGDRLIWKRTDLNADYDNSAFTLKYSARLEGTSSAEISKVKTAQSDLCRDKFFKKFFGENRLNNRNSTQNTRKRDLDRFDTEQIIRKTNVRKGEAGASAFL